MTSAEKGPSTNVKIPKSIYTQDPRDKSASQTAADADIVEAERRHKRAETQFQRYFSAALSGAEMTATTKLADDLETRAKAGNATASYDGMPVTSIAYGPKDGLADHVCYALERIHLCKAAISDAGPHAYNLFYLMERALMEDMTPFDVGGVCARIARKQWKERRQREVGAEVISQAARLIVPVFNRRRDAA